MFLPRFAQANVLDLLASKGADLDARMSTGTTLAHVAARDGDSGCLKVLCERGADVDVPNQLGNTPIMFAAVVGDVNVSVLAFLSCGPFFLCREEVAVVLAAKSSDESSFAVSSDRRCRSNNFFV